MRVNSIDVLRGIAILGILFMNISFHANMELGYIIFDPVLTSDRAVSLFYSVFADGRFRTLFCIIFGVGLAIQYDSCKRKNIDTTIFLKSRLNWLVLFGFIHGVFIFGGDILMLYAITAMFFLKGLTLENEVLLKKAKKFLIIGCLLCLLLALGWMFGGDPAQQILRGSEEYTTKVESWYGNYLYQLMIQAMFAVTFIVISPIFVFWQVLGLMYLGAYLYRTQFFTNGFTKIVLYKVSALAVITTILSILPQILIPNISSSLISLLPSISAVFVALVIAHVVVKLCQRTRGLLSVIMRVLIAPGKLAFSLYILQSISMAIVLRWLMPDFNLTATQLDYFILVVVCTFIQITLANLYLSKYEQGPLEALWRKMYMRSVNRKLQALERVNAMLASQKTPNEPNKD